MGEVPLYTKATMWIATLYLHLFSFAFVSRPKLQRRPNDIPIKRHPDDLPTSSPSINDIPTQRYSNSTMFPLATILPLKGCATWQMFWENDPVKDIQMSMNINALAPMSTPNP